MSNPFFRFKQFTVWHEHCAMKVGTDGVLLGAWTKCDNSRRILDVGTGTGLIALMLAQRNALSEVDAIDIDEAACFQARENVEKSPFNGRIHIFHQSLQDFTSTIKEPYDLIVSNPPYFVESLKCPEEKRRLARHSDTLSLVELIQCSTRILAPDGCLALILPFSQREAILQQAESMTLHVVRELHVIPVENAAPKRILIELSPNEQSHTLNTLILETPQHQRTAEYQALMRDFYL